MQENRGGLRPTAPQNNPANISGTGGAGQSGKATGYAYGMNKAINEQQSQGNAAVASMPQTAPSTGPSLPSITPVTAPTQNPNEPIFNGAPVGPGAGPEAMNLPLEQSEDPDIDMIRSYYPILEFWGSQPDTSQATKDYIQYLRTII